MKLHLLSLTTMMPMAVAAISLIWALVLTARNRGLTRALAALESRLDHELQTFSADIDTVSRESDAQRRRITWLETRLRPRPQADEEGEFVKSAPVQNQKPTITERRHRVLMLARRGKDARAIALTLGIPYGEVELMLNLHAA